MAAPTQPEPAAANSRATAACHSKAKLAEHSRWCRPKELCGGLALTGPPPGICLPRNYIGKNNGTDTGYTLKRSRTQMYCSVNPQHS